MLKAIRQFEELFTLYEHMIPEDTNSVIRENIVEFKGAYDYYNILLKELEDCIGSYKEFHDLLQRMMFPYVRKMNTQAKKKRS